MFGNTSGYSISGNDRHFALLQEMSLASFCQRRAEYTTVQSWLSSHVGTSLDSGPFLLIAICHLSRYPVFATDREIPIYPEDRDTRERYRDPREYHNLLGYREHGVSRKMTYRNEYKGSRI